MLTWLGFTVLPPWYQWRDRSHSQQTSPVSVGYGSTIALFNPLIALGLSAFLWGWSTTVTGRVVASTLESVCSGDACRNLGAGSIALRDLCWLPSVLLFATTLIA
ncbi:MAG: hypothetical protein P3X23_003835 [Thermosynechococcus sp. Uc]|uniref:hypothetical protein n=1 Tax=Thermosynechococcus sp. Uc TaxID=3034853 RepID=UPI00259E7BAC|nr:hypothetical protein [Thermosynechococcus sp. Uc]MDM7326235.1 hypothetical protein [Thermosynechococcus sp. Uc]